MSLLLGFVGSLAWAFDGTTISLGRVGETGQASRLASRASVLTPSEVECLRLAALSNKEIATRLALNGHTVKWYFDEILYKLGAASRDEALVLGMRLGLLTIRDLVAREADFALASPLTITEAAYLRLIALPQKQAADRMGVKSSGAKFNFSSLARKLGARSRGEGMVIGLRLELVSLSELIVSSDPRTKGPSRRPRSQESRDGSGVICG